MTIDIMLPHYGDTALMQAAVQSVLDQTDKDWRLTVVDDGREPDVPEWFASLGDERVRYLRNEVNLGITRNFQKCVDLVEATLRDPFTGLGKPEGLKHLGSGLWSRRLTQEHRLVYLVRDEQIDFLQARYHY